MTEKYVHVALNVEPSPEELEAEFARVCGNNGWRWTAKARHTRNEYQSTGIVEHVYERPYVISD